jgi:hypothetical protein
LKVGRPIEKSAGSTVLATPETLMLSLPLALIAAAAADPDHLFTPNRPMLDVGCWIPRPPDREECGLDGPCPRRR